MFKFKVPPKMLKNEAEFTIHEHQDSLNKSDTVGFQRHSFYIFFSVQRLAVLHLNLHRETCFAFGDQTLARYRLITFTGLQIPQLCNYFNIFC